MISKKYRKLILIFTLGYGNVNCFLTDCFTVTKIKINQINL